MLGRKVERREDMPVVLDLGSLGHRIAQPREYVDDLISHQRDRMSAADAVGRAGTGHVDTGSGGFRAVLHFGLVARYRFGDRVFQRIDPLAEFLFQFGSHLLEFLEKLVHLAFAAEHADSEFLDFRLGFRSELLDPFQQAVYFVNHRWWFIFLSLLLRSGLTDKVKNNL